MSDELAQVAGRRYRNMERRFETRYTKAGQVSLLGSTLPFSLTEFTLWLRDILRTGTTRCIYCDWPVDLYSMQIDHRTPVSRGGALDLFNLAPACAPCNQQKGELTEAGFRRLQIFLTEIDPHDAIDIKARLQSQLKLAIREQQRLKRERITRHTREAVRE